MDTDLRRRKRSSTYESTITDDGTEWKLPVHKTKKNSSICFQIFIISVIAFIAIVLGILLYPSDVLCYRYQLPNRPQLKGVLAVNDLLTKAEYILHEQILGPESLLIEGDSIYTGTQDGIIVEIYKGEIRREIRFKDGPCGNYELEPICGRPLGIRRLNSEELIVADAYLGIYTVNFDKGKFKRILEGGREIDGEPLLFLNDIDVVNEDFVVFTDSSSRWDRRNFVKIGIEAVPNGRVFSLVPSTGEVTLILNNLYFANGIQLFPDKQSFIVAETTMARIMRHWISGPKKGETEVFADNLPGLPDNIRLSTNGTLWVAMAAIRRKTQFSMIDFLGDKVFIRELLLKLLPNRSWIALSDLFKSQHSMIVQLDMEGKIISTAHDLFGDVISDVSQVSDDEKYLYLGSYHAGHIARISKNPSD